MTIHYDGSSSTAQVDQEIEYYPFGKMFSANNTTENKYLYNGKELQNEFFENYDYGARFYDPQIARWHSVDPLAENYYSNTPYNYVGNNPINRVDPDGNDWWDVIKGVSAAISDNMSLGIANRRSSTSYNNPRHYNLGQDIGDALSMAIGGQKLTSAGGLALGGGAVTVISGGTVGVVSIPATGLGVAIAAHGTTTLVGGFRNLMSQEGRVSENTDNTEYTGGGKKSTLTNKQAAEQAGELGFGEKLPDSKIPDAVKSQTKKNPVYYDKATKQYYSPDKAGHRADNAWKQFDNKGNRATGVFENGTFNPISN